MVIPMFKRLAFRIGVGLIRYSERRRAFIEPALLLRAAADRQAHLMVGLTGMIDDEASVMRNFEEAFSSHSGHCVGRCDCGRVFWDGYNSGIDWEIGERETLAADPKATSLEHAVGFVVFEGRWYAMDCDCWHTRARRIIGFLQGHGGEIAEFLRLEQCRYQRKADRAPIVTGTHSRQVV